MLTRLLVISGQSGILNCTHLDFYSFKCSCILYVVKQNKDYYVYLVHTMSLGLWRNDGQCERFAITEHPFILNYHSDSTQEFVEHQVNCLPLEFLCYCDFVLLTCHNSADFQWL